MKAVKSFPFIMLFVIFQFNASSQRNSLPDVSESWVIAGDDSSRILRIDSTLLISDKTAEITKYTRSKFTCVLPLGENKALIGTNGDYLWFYNKGHLEKLDKENGIYDSCIISVSYSRGKKKIYVETDKNGFASTNPGYRNFACFTSVYDENPVQDSILKKFRRGNLIRILTNPIRNLSQVLLPYFADKATEDNSYRKLKQNDLNAIANNIEPCDVILERKNGLATNKFIPEFWTHSALYVGSLKQINSYFAGMPLLNGMNPVQYIHKHYPAVYRKLLVTKNPIIESVTKTGVTISPVKAVTEVDYFALLRTNLSREDKFLSLLRAFEFYRLPYDFKFDLTETEAVACSALVYKSLIPSQVKNGISIPLKSLLGGPMVYPGDFARKFDSEFNSEYREFQLVLFFDSSDGEDQVNLKTAEEFRASWKR